MRQMHISAPTVTEEPDGNLRISSTFTIGDRPLTIWFQTKARPVSFAAAQDAFVAAVLIPAMKVGGTLRVEAPISPRLLTSLHKIQQIISAWYKEFQPINVIAEADSQPRLRSVGHSAQFFSGGFDSFYTLMENREEIQDLYYVRGFDLLLHMDEALANASRRVIAAAKALGKNLIQVDTNVHDISMEFTKWPAHYHGSAMAAIALLMSERNPRFYFASTHTYADLFPWGSHPLLDPLWGNDQLEIIHHGCEASRLEKVYYLAKRADILEYLQVGCAGANCRRTEKCLRSMIALDLAGVLDKVPSFGHPLELGDVEKMEIVGVNNYSFVLENYRELLKRPDKADLRRAVNNAIKRYQNRRISRDVAKNIKSLRTSQHFADIKALILEKSSDSRTS